MAFAVSRPHAGTRPPAWFTARQGRPQEGNPNADQGLGIRLGPGALGPRDLSWSSIVTSFPILGTGLALLGLGDQRRPIGPCGAKEVAPEVAPGVSSYRGRGADRRHRPRRRWHLPPPTPRRARGEEIRSYSLTRTGADRRLRKRRSPAGIDRLFRSLSLIFAKSPSHITPRVVGPSMLRQESNRRRPAWEAGCAALCRDAV